MPRALTGARRTAAANTAYVGTKRHRLRVLGEIIFSALALDELHPSGPRNVEILRPARTKHRSWSNNYVAISISNIGLVEQDSLTNND